MKKILFVDDNEDLRKLVDVVLGNYYQVKLSKNGEEALLALSEFQPDLAILDLNLPDYSGYEICNEIRSHDFCKNIPVIILSAKKGPKAHSIAYKLGADHYLEKPFENDELLAVVESKLKRFSNGKNDDNVSIGNLKIKYSSNEVILDTNVIRLTPKEFGILVSLIKKRGEIVSRESLINSAWGMSAEVTDRTIDNHITSIRKKLSAANIEIISVYSEGYKIIGKSKMSRNHDNS